MPPFFLRQCIVWWPVAVNFLTNQLAGTTRQCLTGNIARHARHREITILELIMTESASVLVLRMEKTTLFHVFLFTDKVGPLLIGITTLSCLLDNPEWGEFWIFCWLAMNTSKTPSHVPTFPSVSPLTVSNYPSGPMALQPTRIHWCAAIKSRAQLHSTAQHTCTARSSADKDCMIATGSEDWPGIVNVTVNTVRLSGLFLLLWCKCWQWTWYVHVTPCPSPPGHCDAAQLTIEEAWKGRPSNLSPTSQSPSGYNPTKNCCSCLSTLQGCWCPHWWVSVCGSRLTRPSTEPRSTCHPDSRDSRAREKTTLNQAAPEIFINSVSNIAGKSFTPMHCNICLEVRITSDMTP